jgi:excisionase family DNA binding protein
VRITFEVDDDDLRQVLLPLLHVPVSEPPTVNGKLLTLAEVAERLDISRTKVHQLIARGEISSISIGRIRRVTPAALAEFLAESRQEAHRNAYVPTPPAMPTKATPRRSPDRAKATSAPTTDSLSTRTPNPPKPPKLTLAELLEPRPDTSAAPRFTEAELQKFVQDLREKGWPTDLVEQIEADEREHVHRVYVLTIKDVQERLGISRYAVEKLVRDGRIRLFTIAPHYRGDKPSLRIPVIDVLRLK